MIKNKKRGVTLVEIAIVLVIIGLLLGGVLKGQELINNAKVRAIADRQSALKVAWFAFIDRYRALPGDFVNAQRYIKGAAAASTTANAVTGDGIIQPLESVVVLQNLTASGYIRCGNCTATIAMTTSGVNSLQNTYGGIMAIFHQDAEFAEIGGLDEGASPRLLVQTGGRIPSNILSEVDVKIDDGGPNTGDLRFSTWDAQGLFKPPVAECLSVNDDDQTDGTLDADDLTYYRHATDANPAVEPNCGAVNFI